MGYRSKFLPVLVSTALTAIYATAMPDAGGCGVQDEDGDGWSPPDDCDDADPSTFPGAPELCDGRDNDCDGQVPVEEQDVDLDGFAQCAADGGPVDCDDADPESWPGAPEECDGRDNDCDGMVPAEEQDGDGDGFRGCASSTGTADCNDADASINPDAAEICGNGVDEDCDGLIDVGTDADLDGASSCTDCNDHDPYTFPGAIERPDLRDNDCDGAIEGTLTLASAHVKLWGDLSSGVVGSALSAGNDVNGDGVGDLLIGASGYDFLYQPSQNRGAVFLLFGQQTGWIDVQNAKLIDHSILIYEDEPSARAGYSVSMAGDLNGDGYGDFVVGAPYHSVSGFENLGQAYISFGRSSGWGTTTLDSASLSMLEGQPGLPYSNNIRVGYAVAGANQAGSGDLNGDGMDDILIGAPWTTQSGASGWVMLIPGATTGWLPKIKSTQVAYLQGPANHGIGKSLALAGRVNGDGLGEFLIGSDFDIATNSGSAFHVLGDTGYVGGSQHFLSTSPEYYGYYSFDNIGWSVSGQADIDSDGRMDILVGRYAAGESGTTGEYLAYVLFGNDIMPSSGIIDVRANLRLTSGMDGLDECPCSVLGVGDMNGDGLDDFAVGVARNDDHGKDAGKVYLFHGRPDRAAWGLEDGATQVDIPLDTADLMVEGEAPDNLAGSALARGDLNADGLMDLIIGAPRWDSSGTTNSGAVYVIFGALAP